MDSKSTTTPSSELAIPSYDRPVHLEITCMNLRHKLMYVDARHSQRGMTDDSSETRIFWCKKTQDALGPDNEAVNPKCCTDSRACYCGDRRLR